MRSSLIVGVALLLTIATTSIVQACKSEHTCGNLGPGINACKCGEIVVKAAKVQKPLFYASPRAINEAAAAREAVGRINVGTEYGISFPKYSSSGTFSGSSASSASDSSMSSSSSSSVGILGGPFGRSNAYSAPFKSVSGKVTSSCGCGKTSESLEVRDLLSSNIEGKIVPSFPPIGDLCYPNPPNGKFQVTTKVTPARPGKIKCGPPIPYEICVKVLNGQIDEAGLRELGLATGGLYGSAFAGGNSLGAAEYTTSDDAATRYGSYGSYGASSASASSASASSTTRGYNAGGSLAGYESYASAAAGAAGYGSYAAPVGASAAGAAASSDFETRSLIQGSSCDFGDDAEFLEDYSYPRLPADPVSLTLAYKNLFPRTVYYSRKAFVPEDKLAFGHRTMPTESTPAGKKMPDVPEEKLQILEKPVVELKPVPSVSITTIGTYDEHEEAKLAELEAIERERINREELAERQRGNFITYGDLGYAPVNRGPGGLRQPLSAGPIGVLNAQDDIGADCGPVGPPDPDYVPGSIQIDRDLVESNLRGEEIEDDTGDSKAMYVRHYAGGDISEEEDDSDDSTSGIFARLKSVARKYGSPCAGLAV